MPLAGQTAWADRVTLAERFQIGAVGQRRVTHDQFWRAVAPALASDRFVVTEVGRSMQGRELRTVTFGAGPVKVFLWSQMHGDEATAPMALADVLAFLASTGSVSPYAGLLGTVWGIMHSFRGLANVGQATLSAVAPGIAEALVATAIGLFAAIPAVVAYNRYSHDIDRLAIRFESFMEEFSNILQRQAQPK